MGRLAASEYRSSHGEFVRVDRAHSAQSRVGVILRENDHVNERIIGAKIVERKQTLDEREGNAGLKPHVDVFVLMGAISILAMLPKVRVRFSESSINSMHSLQSVIRVQLESPTRLPCQPRGSIIIRSGHPHLEGVAHDGVVVIAHSRYRANLRDIDSTIRRQGVLVHVDSLDLRVDNVNPTDLRISRQAVGRQVTAFEMKWTLRHHTNR